MVVKVFIRGTGQFENNVVKTRAEFTLIYKGTFSPFIVFKKVYRCRSPPTIGLKF